MSIIDKLRSIRRPASPSAYGRSGRIARIAAVIVGLAVVVQLLLGWYWSRTPELFDVRVAAQQRSGQQSPVVGYTTTSTLIQVVSTLLDKPGGYLTNDVTPPSIFLDNMPNWEYGVLIQSRDLARALRNDFSRSRSQSMEDPDLAEAEPNLHANNNRWLFPSTESEYRKAIAGFEAYRDRLAAANRQDAQFYARADNLAEWLTTVSKRLGSLTQRLSSSAGQIRYNTDLEGEPSARQSAATAEEVYVRTPWSRVDDVFYEARGSTWALLHFLRAVEVDFHDVLKDKNALVSLRQIIRDLEATQKPIGSPVILNGSGFGVFANHSLTIAAYIARANAALIDLRNLLRQG